MNLIGFIPEKTIEDDQVIVPQIDVKILEIDNTILLQQEDAQGINEVNLTMHDLIEIMGMYQDYMDGGSNDV